MLARTRASTKFIVSITIGTLYLASILSCNAGAVDLPWIVL